MICAQLNHGYTRKLVMWYATVGKENLKYKILYAI